jgi:Mrp family chromosome partitioning ATPase/predicted Fe-Mo cluster-binding NifX family protein
MGQIKHKLIVLSGKGGVGKSTVAAYLATSLAQRGKAVGLLDTDIHGPSIPKMLGIEDQRITLRNEAVVPARVSENLKVMSIAFLLQSKRDAVIWRGPLKMGIIEEFLANVDWGPLDYLIVDSPPGTGDEPLSVCQLIPGLDGALVIATPQEIALADVEKSIAFCGQINIPVVGVIENMSGFVCPHCGGTVDIFKSGGAERLAMEMRVPFLGRLPMVPEVVDACDRGDCSAAGIRSDALKEMLEDMTTRILRLTETAGRTPPVGTGAIPGQKAPETAGHPGQGKAAGETRKPSTEKKQPAGSVTTSADAPGAELPTERVAARQNPERAAGDFPAGGGGVKRIALPVDGDRLSTHFGHSSRFVIFDVTDGRIVGEASETPPPHAPGVIPSWLAELGVSIVLASGLGRRAVAMFEKCGITVVCGAPPEAPRNVAEAYLNGSLVTGENVCDH